MKERSPRRRAARRRPLQRLPFGDGGEGEALGCSNVQAAAFGCGAMFSNPPTSYLRRLHVDTVVLTADQLEALVRVFGVDRVLMGTDYPFDMGEYGPVQHGADAKLDRAEIEAICGGNAIRLLGL